MKSHIDYLRLASWGHLPYTEVTSSLMVNWPGNWERGTWLQYAGWRKESFFIGMGEQYHKRHSIMQVSGAQASQMWEALVEYGEWYCTRIDLQRTTKNPEWSDLSKLFTKLGKKGNSLISSEENDTLYMGARTSDKFVRLYEKMLEEMYLRLEFELKSKRARAAWEAIKNGEDCDRIYDFYLDQLPLPEKYIKLFKNIGHNATEHAMTEELKLDAQKKLAWIVSLDAAMKRAMGDHNIGDDTKLIIRSWSEYADKVDINN